MTTSCSWYSAVGIVLEGSVPVPLVIGERRKLRVGNSAQETPMVREISTRVHVKEREERENRKKDEFY